MDAKIVISYLDSNEKTKLVKYGIIQFVLSLGEILGILLVGLAGAITAARITGQTLPTQIDLVFPWINLAGVPYEKSLAVLVLVAIFLLVTKTVANLFLTFYVNKFLARVTLRISKHYIDLLDEIDVHWLKKQKASRFMYALGEGINNDLKNCILGYYYYIIELIFICTTTIFLLFVNYLLTLIIAILSIILYFILRTYVFNKFHKLGEEEIQLISANNSQVLSIFQSFRELLVSNKLSFFQDRLLISREKQNMLRSKTQWLEQFPKYILELFIIFVTLVLSLLSTMTTTFITASSTILIFIVGLVRLTPSMLRAQMGITLFKQYGARFAETKIGLDELEKNQAFRPLTRYESKSSISGINCEKVSFGHDESAKVFDSFSAIFTIGSVNCIVGDSGAGKTTLGEILIGLTQPDSGRVQIEGLDPVSWRELNPSGLYYIPQDTFIFDGSILDNVVVARESEDVDFLKVASCLEVVGLTRFISVEGYDLNTNLYAGFSLSGGEKQRVALARALYSDAQIIVLDEPTASLDATSEKEIFHLLSRLADSKIIILITHSAVAKNMFERITVI
jgi:ABC-type bacteriocin/lantibiotic exporter with double-glycine peptidase domain